MTNTFIGTPAYTFGPWTPHDGGPCPVPGDTMVQVRLVCERRGEAERLETPASWLAWQRAEEPNPFQRIAEYRVARPMTMEDL